MLTLAFDTSSKTASVAILRNDAVLYDSLINNELNHSEVLLPAIDHACIQTGIRITDIDLFACTLGPGSFTGLRIGAGTLKGFMMATGKPAVGISSLAALALNAGNNSKIICSLMDAGRGQVYRAYFRYHEKDLMEKISSEQAVNPNDIADEFDDETIFVGDGAIVYANILRNKIKREKINIAPSVHQYIRASSVGILGLEKYHRGELLDPATVVPLYLRSADAEKKTLFGN
jgi:tRNA threonylcarbamoyladenosine biosynthesis protein TsaB